MEIEFANGRYIEGNRELEGTVVLSADKLFLRTAQGEMPLTFIPLEKIIRLRLKPKSLWLEVRPTIVTGYRASIVAPQESLSRLTKILIERLHFRKVFLKKEWVKPGY